MGKGGQFINDRYFKISEAGGVYAPCLRYDKHIDEYRTDQGWKSNDKLGCCVVATRGVAGTSTLRECQLLTAGVYSHNIIFI